MFKGTIDVVFHLCGSHPSERYLSKVALHDISHMNIIAGINLTIGGFCRVEHVEVEIAAGQHLQGARSQVGCRHRFCLMSIVEGLTIILLCPSNVGKAGQRLAHQVRHLFFLCYVVCFVDVVECFVV